MEKAYLFTSERLGFRDWIPGDLDAFAAINADEEVMRHFPKRLNKNETDQFIQRLQAQYQQNGYTYFATEILSSGTFIGFIGLAYQDYASDFTPAVDIGWRLKKSAWGKGYATEGAKRCLDFAFGQLGLRKVIATCTADNAKSENVMKKIGMTKAGEFNHPKLMDYPAFQRCLCYVVENNGHKSV
ncbi:GNAT family N-acetyltransferase [Neolewinella lacunae]|uniref:GNAT family N-acetyltransferase n=1 Tax=Neolewinella lacunae TaxID=1517758 RepID=A0A923PPN7_9BACT|nr:GNAT family N-acetyltransferase [Neolewinella lacunae]MBC6995491.1 GNAT family N-acetyltransferase [Neolewinella lacunae]MDN3635079.1 GNAT family N-acetyltransferase [Neolewinella lacunae]